MGCLSENLPGYFPNAEPGFKHWANVWQVDFEWLKARFAPDMMFKNGFSLSRWWQGVLEEETIHNGPAGKLARWSVWNGQISVAQTKGEASTYKQAFRHDRIFSLMMRSPIPIEK
jgi:formate dehydrogenase major subunit